MRDTQQPREPTPEECEQLAVALAECAEYMPHEDDYAEARDIVARACVAVFEDFTADGSDQPGKIVSIVWPFDASYYEVFRWKNGHPDHVAQNPTIAEAHESAI